MLDNRGHRPQARTQPATRRQGGRPWARREPNLNQPEIVGIVLTGGRSRRMGEEKARMVLAGQPLVAHVVKALSQVVSEIWLVGGPEDVAGELGVRHAPDLLTGAGPLAGIYSGLMATGSDALIVACDLPLLQPGLLHGILTCSEGADVVVPVHRGFYEPLTAFYRQTCIPAAATALAAGARKIVDLYSVSRVREIPESCWRRWDPAGLSFLNVNSPEDLETARGLLEDSPGPLPPAT